MRVPIRVITSRAAGSPSCASSVMSGPVSSRPDAITCSIADPGRSGASAVASRTSAVPEATASRHPRLGQFPWQGGPPSSITMWPSSAPDPVAPWNSSSSMTRPPPIPVPMVSISECRLPRAAP
jgi:hypothetical protein